MVQLLNYADMRFLSQTIARNLKWPVEICHQIQRNYFDFANFLDNYVLDENGNRMSLGRACTLFEVKLEDPLHDPAVDALNLANLYNAFIQKRDLVKDEYKKVLAMGSHLPEPVAAVIKKLASGEDVTSNDFDDEIKRYLA